MLEAELQRKIIAKLRAEGYLVMSVDGKGVKGIPDLTALSPEGEVTFIEVKTKSGLMSPHQIRMATEIHKRGGNWLLATGLDDIDLVLENKNEV